jgi:hypothetical protein
MEPVENFAILRHLYFTPGRKAGYLEEQHSVTRDPGGSGAPAAPPGSWARPARNRTSSADCFDMSRRFKGRGHCCNRPAWQNHPRRRYDHRQRTLQRSRRGDCRTRYQRVQGQAPKTSARRRLAELRLGASRWCRCNRPHLPARGKAVLQPRKNVEPRSAGRALRGLRRLLLICDTCLSASAILVEGRTARGRGKVERSLARERDAARALRSPLAARAPVIALGEVGEPIEAGALLQHRARS